MSFAAGLLGGNCSETTVCIVENSVCEERICQCSNEFRDIDDQCVKGNLMKSDLAFSRDNT